MSITNILIKSYFFFLPSLFFLVSYRFPLILLLFSLFLLMPGMFFIALYRPSVLKSKEKAYLNIVVFTCFLYGVFKALSFSRVDVQFHTFLYYAVFVSVFLIITYHGLMSYLRVSVLSGFVFIAFAIQILYLQNFLEWNQYQIVGNVTFLGLLSAFVLRRYFLVTILALLVLNTPSSQAQVLLILFFSYIISELASRSMVSKMQKFITFFMVAVISVPLALYLILSAGDYLMFSSMSNSRQFDFETRFFDRTLIFYDHIRIIEPFVPISQYELTLQSAFTFDSAEARVHGIWLANLVYMGFFLGLINIFFFIHATMNLLRGNLLLIAISLTPWLVSSEVNPIKFAICAIAISSVLIKSKSVNQEAIKHDANSVLT